jgi:hypothetical protein
MAITNAQQFKQLVNPPMDGKRPGYRGEAAAASDAAGGRNAGRSNTGSASGRGDGPGSSGPSRNPMAQFGFTPEEKAAVKAAAQSELARREELIGFGDKTGLSSLPSIFAKGLNLFKVKRGNEFAQGLIGNLTPRALEANRDSNDFIGDTPLWAQLGFNSEAEYLASLQAQETMDQELEVEEEGLLRRFRADGGRIGFRGGDAARSDAASGRNAGRADPSGGVDDRSDARQTAINNAAIMMARMQNQNLNEIKNPNLIEKFPGGVRAIDRINLDRMLANKNLNNITTDDDEDANAINTVFSPDIAPNLQTVFGTGLSDRQQIEKNILDSMADGGRAGLAEGGMPYEGGIMDLESARQMYGLGKLVKKVTRTVKKIAKSPIGKAALLYTGVGGLGNMAAGQSFFSNFASPSTFLGGASNIFKSGGLRNILVGRPESIISPKGSDIFRQAATKGIFGAGGELSPLKAISAVSAVSGLLTAEQEEEAQLISDQTGIDIEEIRANPNKYLARRFRAEGGSMDEPVAKKTMPLLDMDGKEMDLRAEGGFVPIGRMEKADDVPARLSKNEFVFTADAVRNAGDGDVDKGAEVMYNMMKNLESGGDVSEESQGLEGARKMFQTSQRLEEVL